MKNYIVTASMAILHNGKRYEQGDQIELTPQQADKLALYVELDKKAEKAEKTEKANKTKEKTDKQANAQQAEQVAEAPQE